MVIERIKKAKRGCPYFLDSLIFFDLDNTLWDHRKNAYLTLKSIFEKENIKQHYQIDFEEFHNEYFTINENLWAQIRDGKIDKNYIRKHRFYDSFLFFNNL